MPITQIHSFLVHPSKHEDEPPLVHGARLPHHGKLFQMLTILYNNSDNECDIDIAFRQSVDGVQENECEKALLQST